MSNYVVTYRKRHMDKDILHQDFVGRINAIEYSVMIYNRFQMDRVLVIMVEGEEKEIIFKAERNCKHVNTQMEFEVLSPSIPSAVTGGAVNRCLDCGELIVAMPKELTCV